MKTLIFFTWFVIALYNAMEVYKRKGSLIDYIVVTLWFISYPIFFIHNVFTRKDVLILFAMFMLCAVACYVSFVAYNAEICCR